MKRSAKDGGGRSFRDRCKIRRSNLESNPFLKDFFSRIFSPMVGGLSGESRSRHAGTQRFQVPAGRHELGIKDEGRLEVPARLLTLPEQIAAVVVPGRRQPGVKLERPRVLAGRLLEALPLGVDCAQIVVGLREKLVTVRSRMKRASSRNAFGAAFNILQTRLRKWR